MELDQLILSAANLLSGLPGWAQAAVLLVLGILIMVPQIAPLTPWTWDDWTIQHKGKIQGFLGKVWNILAGNWGKAKNGD